MTDIPEAAYRWIDRGCAFVAGGLLVILIALLTQTLQLTGSGWIAMATWMQAIVVSATLILAAHRYLRETNLAHTKANSEKLTACLMLHEPLMRLSILLGNLSNIHTEWNAWRDEDLEKEISADDMGKAALAISDQIREIRELSVNFMEQLPVEDRHFIALCLAEAGASAGWATRTSSGEEIGNGDDANFLKSAIKDASDSTVKTVNRLGQSLGYPEWK